jgi:hypothetical protein
MITRYVNTASTSGGDGTTNGTVGANRAFNKLASAESALRNAALDDDLEIVCCGATADNASVTFDENSYNYVTAGHTITIRANRNDPAGFHGGKWNTQTYRLERNLATVVMECYRDIIIDGIQIWDMANGWTSLLLNGRRSNGLAIIKNCIFRGQNAVGHDCVQVTDNSGTFSYKFENCAFTGPSTNAGCWDGILVSGTVYSLKVYNCVFSRNITGIGNMNNALVKNCSFSAVSTLYSNGSGSTFDHNATDTGTGTNPITVSNWSDEFYNANYASELDFSLKQTSQLLNAGVGPGIDSDVPSTDMLTYTRSGSTTTIGIFQYWYSYVPPYFPSDPYDGEEHRAVLANSLYVYDASRTRWVKSLTSSHGVTGIVGLTGASTAGMQGAQGIAGSVGVPGATGDQGATGVGVQGSTGAGGLTGLQGATGIQGPTGPDPGETGYLNFVFNNPYTGTVNSAMLPVNMKIQSWEVVSSDVCSFRAALRVGSLANWPPSFVMATGIGMTGVFKDASVDMSAWAGTTGAAHDYMTVTVTDTDTPESLTLALGYYRT